MRNITSTRARTALAVTLPIVLASVCVAVAPPVMAQTGGGAGGTGGAGSGATGGAGSTTGGSGGAPGAPIAKPPPTGPQIRSPATPPSAIPQPDTGVPPVPSAGNAERSSPIYRQDKPPGSLTPSQNTPGSGLPDAARPSSPTDTPLGSGGSGASQSPDTSGDALTPTDPTGSPADYGSGRPTNSISDEPNRVRRGGAAGRDLTECMNLWDKSTHMTREQWRTTCERLGR